MSMEWNGTKIKGMPAMLYSMRIVDRALLCIRQHGARTAQEKRLFPTGSLEYHQLNIPFLRASPSPQHSFPGKTERENTTSLLTMTSLCCNKIGFRSMTSTYVTSADDSIWTQSQFVKVLSVHMEYSGLKAFSTPGLKVSYRLCVLGSQLILTVCKQYRERASLSVRQ